MLSEVIRESQHVFVEGRQILDAVLLANEMVNDLVACKKEGIMCKLDIEKAYDHVNWYFVDYILWVNWDLGRSG